MLEPVGELVKMLAIVLPCSIAGIILFHFFVDFLFCQLMKSTNQRWEEWEEDIEELDAFER